MQTGAIACNQQRQPLITVTEVNDLHLGLLDTYQLRVGYINGDMCQLAYECLLLHYHGCHKSDITYVSPLRVVSTNTYPIVMKP